MAEIYPDPPHLTIAVYSDGPEAQTFAAVHDAAQELGCRPLDLVEVAPANQEFELVSDLGSAREILSVSPTEYARLVAGQDPKARVLRAGAVHRKLGKVVIGYVQRTGPGLHPIAVSMSAEALGVPASLWSADQRRAAYSAGDWCRSLLEVASSRSRAMYGAIGVEFSLPTPWQIRTKDTRLPSEFFISRQLIDRKVATEGLLQRAFSGGETVIWDTGIFLSGWAPFNSKRATMSDVTEAAAAVVVALRSVLQ